MEKHSCLLQFFMDIQSLEESDVVFVPRKTLCQETKNLVGFENILLRYIKIS